MLAILQMADTPQIEQTAQMLRAAGYDEIKICGRGLRTELAHIGCDTLISLERMISLGYDNLEEGINQATVADMDRCDLFVCIKVRNVEKVWNRWPHLKDKILWWRVNGSQPEICPNGGDEVNLICPIATACMWYGTERYTRSDRDGAYVGQNNLETMDLANNPPPEVSYEELREYSSKAKRGFNEMAYTFWPSYPRSADYDSIDRSDLIYKGLESPYNLCHNPYAWGYGEIVDRCVDELDMNCYGNRGRAKQIQHSAVPDVVSKAKALIHLKVVDCPGWTLYEAMLGGCPVIVGRLLNSRMLAYDLLEDGVTCLEFGVPASHDYGRGEVKLDQCFEEIKEALEKLSDPQINYEIGQAGRKRLNGLMWSEEKDGDDFCEFMKRWFS